MRTLDVPTVGLSELKRTPTDVFEIADKKDNAVYVFNRGTIVGVLMTADQFEQLNTKAERFDEMLDEEVLLHRAKSKHFISDNKVRNQSSRAVKFDNNDGWE